MAKYSIFRSKTGQTPRQDAIVQSIVVAALVFLGCEIGVHSRVLLDLGSIWPANAMLLSIFILRPRTNRPLTWILSAAAYLVADALAGSPLDSSLLLNGTNLLVVAVGLLAYRAVPADTFRLGHPINVVYVA
jgi:hypothetical protein